MKGLVEAGFLLCLLPWRVQHASPLKDVAIRHTSEAASSPHQTRPADSLIWDCPTSRTVRPKKKKKKNLLFIISPVSSISL
jgi:hypothetical protein